MNVKRSHLILLRKTLYETFNIGRRINKFRFHQKTHRLYNMEFSFLEGVQIKKKLKSSIYESNYRKKVKKYYFLIILIFKRRLMSKGSETQQNYKSLKRKG